MTSDASRRETSCSTDVRARRRVRRPRAGRSATGRRRVSGGALVAAWRASSGSAGHRRAMSAGVPRSTGTPRPQAKSTSRLVHRALALRERVGGHLYDFDMAGGQLSRGDTGSGDQVAQVVGCPIELVPAETRSVEVEAGRGVPARVAGVRGWLGLVDVEALSDRERVDLVAELERLKGAACAAQARATDHLRCSRRRWRRGTRRARWARRWRWRGGSRRRWGTGSSGCRGRWCTRCR